MNRERRFKLWLALGSIAVGLLIGGPWFGRLFGLGTDPKTNRAVEVGSETTDDSSTGDAPTWELTPDKVDLAGKPDPLVTDTSITAQWKPADIREVESHPMGTHIAMNWRDSHLKNTKFESAIIRPFAAGKLERYFLIYVVDPSDTTVDAVLHEYAAAMDRDDPKMLVWPDAFPAEKAVILAASIHRKEYARDDLHEGDRVLLLVPGIHYVGQSDKGVF